MANDGVHEEEEDHKSHEAETEGHQTGECVDDLLHRHPVPAVKPVRSNYLLHSLRVCLSFIAHQHITAATIRL